MPPRRSSATPLLRRDSALSAESTDSDDLNKDTSPSRILPPVLVEESEGEDGASHLFIHSQETVRPNRDWGEAAPRSHTDYVEVGNTGREELEKVNSPVQCFKMFAACLAFMPVGMATSILGATLLELETQTQASSGHMAMLFTWRGLGAVTGNLFAGLIYSRLRPGALLGAAVLLLGLTQLLIPLSHNYLCLVAAVVLSGGAIGALGTGLNSYVVELWKSRSAPFIQCLHFSVSFGSMLGPLLSAPFLGSSTIDPSPEPYITQDDQPNREFEFYNNYSDVHSQARIYDSNMDIIANDEGEIGIALDEILQRRINDIPEYTVNTTANSTNQYLSNLGKSSNLLYPYLIISVLCSLSSMLCLCILFCQHQMKRKAVQTGEITVREKVHHSGQRYQTLGLVLLNLICLCAGSMEGAFGGYIVVFAIQHLRMTASTAALLATTFWGSFAFGRGFSILLVQCLKPRTILIADWFVVSLSLVVFSMSGQAHIAITFVCCSLIGLALSTILGNVLSYTNRHLTLSSKVTASYVISFYLGMMSCPSVVGYLMNVYTPEAMLYCLLPVAMVALLVFSVLHILMIRQVSKRSQFLAVLHVVSLGS